VALSNNANMVLPHVDSHNDISENFQGVINCSCWLQESTGKWWRLSIVGCSRKSCAGSICRRDLCMPLVVRIVKFCHAMPEERKLITPKLLDFESHNGVDPAKSLAPHADKCAFCGIFIDCVNKLHKKFGFLAWHLLAVLVNTVASESPDFFVATAKHFLSLMEGKEAKLVGDISHVEFACVFCDRPCDDKDERRKVDSSTPGQHHQPHHNKRQPRSVIVASIQNSIRLHKACALIDPKLASDRHHHARAVAALVQGHSTSGVHGAGALTALHLIHITVLCGFLPPQFICHAEIGETTDSCAYPMLGVTALMAENIVCKFRQSQQTQAVQPPTPKVAEPMLAAT
jgi:hypothetical protein